MTEDFSSKRVSSLKTRLYPSKHEHKYETNNGIDHF